MSCTFAGLQSLCQAACGFPSADSPQPLATSPAGAYIANLLGPTAAEVRALAARPDLGSLAARADVVAALCGMLEALRGGACRGAAAAGAAARAAGWALLAGELLGPLLALQRSAAGEDPRVSALLLKLAAAVVEHHVGYLQVGARGEGTEVGWEERNVVGGRGGCDVHTHGNGGAGAILDSCDT